MTEVDKDCYTPKKEERKEELEKTKINVCSNAMHEGGERERKEVNFTVFFLASWTCNRERRREKVGFL